jgi:DNA-binding NarL/FixJ family response regulator
VLLCDPAAPPDLSRAMRAGARGFLTRETAHGDLILAIDAVRRSGLHIAAELLGPLTAARERRHQLGDREIGSAWVRGRSESTGDL